MAESAELLTLSTDEYETFLSDEIGRWQDGLSLAKFISAYREGRLDDSDPEVARLAALIGLGQNGR